MDGVNNEPTWIEKFVAEKKRADAADAAAHLLRQELTAARASLPTVCECVTLNEDLEKAQIQKRELADLLLEIMAEQSFPGGPPARVAALIREALS